MTCTYCHGDDHRASHCPTREAIEAHIGVRPDDRGTTPGYFTHNRAASEPMLANTSGGHVGVRVCVEAATENADESSLTVWWPVTCTPRGRSSCTLVDLVRAGVL